MGRVRSTFGRVRVIWLRFLILNLSYIQMFVSAKGNVEPIF